TRRGGLGRCGGRTRTRDIKALLTLNARARADAALGLDDHGLGSAVAEALLHGAGRNRSRLARPQAQRRAGPRGGGGRAVLRLAVGLVVVLVAHPVAFTRGGHPPMNSKTQTAVRRLVSLSGN